MKPKTIMIYPKIDWTKIADLVKYEDILLCLPNQFLGVKKNKNFLCEVKKTLNYFKKLNSTHWLSFYNESDLSLVKKAVEQSYNWAQNSTHSFELKDDLSLFSHEGELLDSLTFLDNELCDSKHEVDFSEIILDNRNFFTEKSRLRSMDVDELAPAADCFLKKKTIGRYHLDPAAAPFTGVAYEYKTPSYPQFNYGYGRAFDFKTAKNIASLEAVERYASQFYTYDFKNYVKEGSYDELSEMAIEPSNFYLEKNSKVKNSTELIWTKAYSVRDKKDILVPEDLVYYGNNPSRPNYTRSINDSSNGVALGSTYAEAMIYGLLELIERHSFLATWYGGIPGKKIENYHDFLGAKELQAVKNLTIEDAELTLFEISLFPDVYVIWALIISTGNKSTISTYTSAGSGFSLEEAIKSAVMEVSVGYLVQKNYHDSYPDIPSKINKMDDHIEYFGNPTNIKEFDFTKHFPSVKYKQKTSKLLDDFDNQEEVLRYLLNEILCEYRDIYFANLTSERMNKLQLHVVKAIIPGFLPITFGQDNLRIDLEDINTIRRNKNLEPLNSINRRPHPFP